MRPCMILYGMRKKPDWFYEDALARLIAVLNDGEYETRYVGGCVRDVLLGRQGGDIDMATQLAPEQVMQRCADAGVKTVPTGLEHGTVTVVLENRSVEVTTLRRDVATDGRRAVVEFTKDWVEDAKRRDFTLNTVSMTGSGEMIDPLGVGMDDIAAGRLVFVGDPVARIKEDGLRILRYFRFLSLFPDSSPDPESMRACVRHWDLLAPISRERKTQEMRLMLLSPDGDTGLACIAENGLCFGDLRPQIDQFRWVQQLSQSISIGAEAVKWLALFPDHKADQIAACFCLRRKTIKQMQVIENAKAMSVEDIYLLSWKQGKDIGLQAAIYAHWNSDSLKHLQAWECPTCPITAAQIMREEGLQPGPELGARLQKREKDWFSTVVKKAVSGG